MTKGRRRWRVRASGVLLGAVLLFALGRVLLDRAVGGALVLRDVTRHQLAPGVELLRADLFRGFKRSGQFVALYAEPDRIDLSILLNDHQDPLSQLAEDALLVVNGSYFTPERRPTGLLVSGGRILSPLVRKGGGAGTGVLVVNDQGAALFQRERIERSDYAESRFAIQAGPRVIEPGGIGGIRSDDGSRANRTVIGADKRGRVAIAVTYDADGARTGATLFELMNLLGDQGLGRIWPEVAFDFALNLDGGPSTGLILRDGERSIALPETVRVYSVVALRIAE